jgi:hypothetical protein
MNINIPQILSKGEGVSVEFKKAKKDVKGKPTYRI